MLQEIHIRNFALAEELKLSFKPGLNIITGETGTGKSILVGAIDAVLGSRVQTESVRTGAERATVQAVFDIANHHEVQQLLESRGLAAEDGLLFLRREINAASGSRAFVNDNSVTATVLSEIGRLLMDIHGQHEHQSLLRKETHRQHLDAYGRHESYLADTAAAWQKSREAKKALRDLQIKKSELEQQYELSAFQFREIDAAGLTPGEDEALEAEHPLLANTEKLFSLSSQVSELFNGEDSNLLHLLGEAQAKLRNIGEFSDDMQRLSDEFAQARVVIEETAQQNDRFSSKLEFDPQRLDEVEARMLLLNQLKKKYGATIDEVIAYQEELARKIRLKDNFDREIEVLEKNVALAAKDYSEAALRLSSARKKTAEKMAAEVIAILRQLGMPDMRFKAQIDHDPDPNGPFQHRGQSLAGDAMGIDRIEFYISANPGEAFKPLHKIASGGEISRIMLSLKQILAHIDRIPALVFDEVDAGISGRIAQAVGNSIHQLSSSHQIICITHLPQIAAYGNAHFSVEKHVEGERTFTRILPLDENRRIEEIARLMAGAQISDAVRQSARQLIAESR